MFQVFVRCQLARQCPVTGLTTPKAVRSCHNATNRTSSSCHPSLTLVQRSVSLGSEVVGMFLCVPMDSPATGSVTKSSSVRYAVFALRTA